MKQRDKCPTPFVLQAYFDERLPGEVRRRIPEHLAGCPRCRAHLEHLHRTRRLLRQAAEYPLPVLDEQRLLSQLLAPARARRIRIWRPALAWSAAAVVLSLVSWWWLFGRQGPRQHRSPPASGSRPAAPVVARGEGVLVEWLAGTAGGISWRQGRWRLEAGEELALEAGGQASLWLDERRQLLVRGPARLRVERRGDDVTVLLERGNLLSRLRRPLSGRFRVVHGELEVEATGTIFAVETQQQALLLEMIEGRVKYSWRRRSGESGSAAAPQCWRLEPGRVRRVACHGPGQSLLRLARDGAAPVGEAGYLRVDGPEPGALVEVDGREYGRVPLTVALAPGPHRLLLRAGAVRAAETVEVKAAATVERRLQLPVPETVATTAGEARPDVVPSETALPSLQRVRHLLAQRRFAAAEKLLERVLAQRPQDWRARLLEADARRLQGQNHSALELYRRVARQAREATLAESAAYQQGLLLLGALARPREARAVFEKLLKSYPQGLLRQETLAHLVEALLLLEDWPAALAAARQYLREFPQGLKREQMRRVVERLRQRDSTKE